VRLQTRLALLFGAVVTAAAALMGVLAYAAIAGRLASEVDASLLEVSAPLAEELTEGGLSRDLAGDGDDRRGPRDRGLVLPTQVLLVDGSVERLPTNTVLLPVDDTDLALARSLEPAQRFRDVTVDDVPMRMVTQTEGAANGAIQVGRDVTENVAVLRSLAGLLTLIGVAVASLAALAGWLLARRSAARLVELTEAAEQVSETGQLDVPVPTGGTDEIGRLGTAFDAMLLRLGQSREDQQRLVQDAGHELRTPLTSLRTNVHLLGRYDALQPETRARVIADLQGETTELTHLVNEIVHLAESGPADAPPQPVPLARLAESVAARATRRTGRTIDLTVDGSTVLGNPTALERAIWNLVENAVKFSPDDTPIELVVEQGTVIVRDHGPGINPADLPHVFDRFYRSTAARALPGSGLGLAIVRDVTVAHGGQVFATNQPDGGAQLGFSIPLSEPAT
jgi:two-component system sensor histidine kinase MprB